MNVQCSDILTIIQYSDSWFRKSQNMIKCKINWKSQCGDFLFSDMIIFDQSSAHKIIIYILMKMKMHRIKFLFCFIFDEILRNLKFEIMSSCSLRNGIKSKMCPCLRVDDIYVPPARYEEDPFLRYPAGVDWSMCVIWVEMMEFFNVGSDRSVCS